MSFFDTILLNTICIMFPLLVYLIYLAYLNNNNENLKFESTLFEIALVTSLFFTIKLTGNRYNNYTIILLNIPILFSYLRGKTTFALILSFIVGMYYIVILDYNIFFVLLEYLSYYFLYFIESRKNITATYIINWFTLIKAFFFSFLIFYSNTSLSFISAFNNIFISLIVFYLCSNFYYVLLSKGEEIVNLNNLLRELEKEKTLRNSLFKLTHEIKNPIAVCKGYLDMINLDDVKTSQKYVSIIKGEINRTLVIMDDFLDYTKIKVEKNIMDINFLLEDTINSLSSLFKSHNVLTKFDIKDDEIYINGDYNRLKQVLINVIKNAIESKQKDKKLKLSIITKEENGNFKISIKDNGIGMNMDELNNLGKAFYTTKNKGTGLGVLLSKEIIELHDGSIIYTSAKGEGTTVDIILPIIDI